MLFLFWLYSNASFHPVISTVENVKEVLKLTVEQKGALVPAGELTVYLNGLTVSGQEELAPLTNGNAANGTSELSISMFGVGEKGGLQIVILVRTSGWQSSMKQRERNVPQIDALTVNTGTLSLIIVQQGTHQLFFQLI